MEAKLLAALNTQASVSVTELCAQLGISRQTFYKYRRRFEREGPAGLIERSRRPRRSPQLMSVELEDEIVRLRKELPLDNGARTIAFHLARQNRAEKSNPPGRQDVVGRAQLLAFVATACDGGQRACEPLHRPHAHKRNRSGDEHGPCSS